MTHQGNIWDKEYKNPKLVTGKDGPQADTLRFLKFLKKIHLRPCLDSSSKYHNPCLLPL